MGVSIYRVKEPEGVPKYWAYVKQITASSPKFTDKGTPHIS